MIYLEVTAMIVISPVRQNLGMVYNFGNLGQTRQRSQILQDGITYSLNSHKWTTFPEGTWAVNDQAISSVVTRALQFANDVAEGYEYPEFTFAEGEAALANRGYVSSMGPPIAPSEPPPEIIPSPAPPQTIISPPVSPPVAIQPVPAPTYPVSVPEIRPEPKTPPSYLWIIGLLALFLFARGGSSPQTKRKRRTKRGQKADLQGLDGDTSNCAIWQEVPGGKTGGTMWRCLGYGTTCRTPGKCKTGKFEKYQTKTCVKTKKVKALSGKYNVKKLTRCSKYSPICNKELCLPETLPKPKASPAHGANINQMTKDLAKQMADERNIAEEEVGKDLGREILSNGGLRPYRKMREGALRTAKKRRHEEFDIVPIFMRRKDGLPLDEMAATMGFEDDTALLNAIEREYLHTGAKGHKKQRRYKQVKEGLEAEMWNIYESKKLSGLTGLEGAPDYVWKSTLREFTERPRKTDDPALPNELNWILKRTKTNPEGHLRVFRGKLPGHMTKRLREWLWDRHRDPDTWLEDKRLKIGFRGEQYQLYHPFYFLGIKFYKDGSLLVTEDRGGYHGDSIIEAIKEGKNVPKKVLTEYAPFIPEAKKLLSLKGLSGKGDLFPELRRELVLETEDTATSDEPLEVFLQRKGWKLKRIRELQDSIIEKIQPDIFTGKTIPLDRSEQELQADTEEFFSRIPSVRKPKPQRPRKRSTVKIEPGQMKLSQEPQQVMLFGS
jgi:hypothetical protein